MFLSTTFILVQEGHIWKIFQKNRETENISKKCDKLYKVVCNSSIQINWLFYRYY